jgi:predicted  nucleic acid-binding Zn-ribbon protein
MSFVQVQCSRCKTVFRDNARRLQDGYSRQCPCCEVVMFFAEDSPNPQVKLAMKRARRVRKELHEAAAAKASASPSKLGLGRRFAGRRQQPEQEEQED